MHLISKRSVLLIIAKALRIVAIIFLALAFLIWLRESIEPLFVLASFIVGSLSKVVERISSPILDAQRFSSWTRHLNKSYRHRILERVKKDWIEDVLKNSLHNKAIIELGMQLQPEEVVHPWNMILQQPPKSNYLLPAGTKIIEVFGELKGELLIFRYTRIRQDYNITRIGQ